jgi:hypothetical protein
VKRKGPWTPAQIDRFLTESRIPARVACNGSSGHPILGSLWFMHADGSLWCAMQRTASIVSALQRDPRCSFEVSLETPPYRGVRGAAMATLHEERGEEVLRMLIERYLADRPSQLASLLLARAESEIAIELQPRTMASWDYHARMREEL